MFARFMRIIVMFDLPTDTIENKKLYARFRKFLICDGYTMIQYSVYSRICRDGESARLHIERLKRRAPQEGAVRVLLITNKQFADAVIVTGIKTNQEKKINESQLLLF
jgi:CRISPR-associated protein Cas2